MQPIFDASLIIAHRRRAAQNPVTGADFLVARAAEDLAERLAIVERQFERAAAIFGVSPAATAVLAASGKAAEIVRVEADATFLGDGLGMVSDVETITLQPKSIDLAVSLLALQEANDIPGQLVQIRRTLRPDGLFLGVLAGAGTLAELRESLLAAETELTGGASPRIIPFIDLHDAGSLLQRAGFALPVVDVERMTVNYDNMFALMADLKAMGVTSALVDRSRKPTTRRLFQRAAEIYAERFSDSNRRVRASFSFVWLSGWAA